VVIAPGKAQAFIWRGKYSDDNEYNHAFALVKALDGGKTIEITEGNEGDDFWTALGGKGDY